MKTTKLTSLLVLAGSITASQASITLLTEDFSYADGDLTGVSGGTWTNHSGSAEFIQVVGGEMIMLHGGGSREDVGATFATTGSGVLTAEFDLTVTDDTLISGGDYEYFAHFMTEGSFTFRSRLDIVEAAGGGDFTLGLDDSSSTASVIFGSDLDFGTTYRVALTYSLDDGSATLTVDGTGTITAAGDNPPDVTSNRFAFRQSSSSNQESITVDNLVVTSSIPEPSTSILGALALLGLVRRKR